MLAERIRSESESTAAPASVSASLQASLRASLHGRSVLRSSPALLRAAAAQTVSYSWMFGASIAGLLLATAPFLADVSILAASAAVAGAVASISIWYMTAGRNQDAWRTLAASPQTIEGAPLRRLLDGSSKR